MEGAGARLGRPSSRYAPTSTVFNGPVRKWKKKWTHYTSNIVLKHHNHSRNYTNNETTNLILFRWSPVTQSQNNGSTGSTEDGSVIVEEETTVKRRFRYIPVAVLEEQKNNELRRADEEKSNENMEPNSMDNAPDEKPDINDATMEENQDPDDDDQVERGDMNEKLLDLNLGLKANDGDQRMDTKIDDDETEE